jgi:hypothetical protein
VRARWPWALALLALPSTVAAQQAGVSCDTCESCTAALAAEHAFAELRGDVDGSRAGTCIRVVGRGATLDGHGHTVRGAAVGVEVAGEDIVVRNVQAQEGGVGFRVAGAGSVTLLNAAVTDARVGVRIEGSRHVRVLRATLARNRVGVSMGADDAGRCVGPTALESPGVVIARSRVEGGSVGVAACDAMPVLIANTVVGNEVGVLLGEVRAQGSGDRAGAWDECSCAPAPAGTPAGTLLLYSSGCGGCTVHESWLPQERARGAVLRARAGGGDGGAEQARFDGHIRHCGPEVVDALGIPGCVPNYACPASAEVWKRRQGARELVTDRSVATPDEVVAFSEACRAAAREAYGRGGRCVTAALRSNTLCGNRRTDLSVAGAFARWGSTGDRCGVVEGDGARCAQGCDGVETALMSSAASIPTAAAVPAAEPQPVVEAGDAGAAVPAREAAPAAEPWTLPRVAWPAAGAALWMALMAWYVSAARRQG